MAVWKKLLLGTVVVGSCLLIALALLVKIYVTPERVRNLVQSGIEKSLQRKVSLGAVDVGLFSGINLAGLTIAAKDEGYTLLSAEQIEISYDFLALLRGKLFLGQVLLMEPQLRLVRETDGRLNIDDLFAGPAAAARVGTSGNSAGKTESSVDIPLLVKKISLQGGMLQFIDRKFHPDSPYRYRLEKLDVDIDNFSLKEAFPIHLSAHLNDAPVAVDLQFDINDGLQKLKIHVNQLNLVPFLPYVQDLLPGNLGQGFLSTELQVTKQPAGFATKGQIVVDQLDIRLAIEKPIQWNGVRVALDQELLYRSSDQVIDVKKLHLDLNGLQADYRGKVLLAEPLQIAGEGTLTIADLREISALVPLEMRDQVAAYVVAGRLDASLQLQGEPVALEFIRQATINARDLQASIGELRPALNGTFKYSAAQVQADHLIIDLNGQQVGVALEVKNILSSPPNLQLKITGEKLNLDALFPPQKQASRPDGAGNIGREKPGPSNRVQREPLVLPIDGRAGVQFAQLLYRGLLFEKVQGQATLAGDKISLESLTAVLADGAAELSAELALAEPRVPLRGKLNVDGINLATFTDALFPDAKGSVSGTLVAHTVFNGFGATADVMRDLTADCRFDLKDGEIKGSPLLAGLSQFLTNPELEVLGFSRLHGNLGLKSRQGTLDAKLESRRVYLAPQGKFSLDGPLDMALETRVSPELMARSGVGGKGAEMLKDDAGWSLLPLKVKGTYSKPRFILDAGGVKKQLEKGVVRELGRQLQKKLGGTGDQDNQKIQQLLDGTLQKLFGN